MVNKKVKSFLLSAILLFSCLLMTLLSTPNMMIVHAANIEINGGYSDVMEDLECDEEFDADSYKIDQSDYSLNLITLAESQDRELFVYVYQPCTSKGIVATTINISTGINDNLSYKNCKLKLLSQRGVFNKYLVEDLIVSEDEVRYYDISSIFRAWSKDLGDADAESGTISEVPFAVAKQYVASGSGDNITYSCSDVDVITITSKYVGFVRYEDGDWWHLWGESACDRHFVAFNTDRQIDELLEADVFYQSQSFFWRRPLSWMYKDSYSYGNVEDKYAYLDKTKSGVYDNSHNVYTWERIQSVDDFVKSVNITNVYECGIFNVSNETKIREENLDILKKQKWVLSFLETPYEVTRSLEEEHYSSTRVSNVTILRLKFKTNGVVYNLGVIDNKMTGTGTPINDSKTTFEFTESFKTFIAILLFIVLILVLWPVLPYIFSFIAWLLKGLWKIITLPFKVFKSSKKDKQESQQEKQKTDKKKK